jgi:hypothetical protein
MATIAGAAIAIYIMRPILTPSSLENGSFSPESSRVLITNNGQLTMYNVEESCNATKVVFGGRHTLDPVTFELLFADRTVPDVKPGEPFPVECVQAWHLLISKNNDSGLLAFGDVPTQPNGTQIIRAFQINSDKTIRVTHTPLPGDHLTPDSFAAAIDVPITGIDMSVKINYDLFFHLHRFARYFRYITLPAANNGLTWVLVPETHARIPSGTGGLNLALIAGQSFPPTLVSKKAN